jgi:hypothetical protein
MKNKVGVIVCSIFALLGLALIIVQAYNNTLPNENDKVYTGKFLQSVMD